MTPPDRGDIWLLRFPFSDLTTTKVRPALIWAAHGDDLIVLGIFSRRLTCPLAASWVTLDSGSAAFAATGLKVTSVLKAEKIAVVHGSVLARRLGEVGADTMATVRDALKRALLLDQ